MTQKQFLDKWLPEDASPEAEDTFRAELAMVAQPASFLTQQTINAAADNHAQQFNDAQGHKPSFLAGAAFAQDGGMRWVEVKSRAELSWESNDQRLWSWYKNGDKNQPKCEWASEREIKVKHDCYIEFRDFVANELRYLSQSPSINQGGEKTL